MARKLRIQYPGAIYHVMNRGDHQERVFYEDDDRKRFLATLAEGCDKAERLIVQALRVAGIGPEQLARWRKGHPFKVALAAKLRAETTVSVRWIAQGLAMGTRGHLAHRLYLQGQTPSRPQPSNQPGLNI
jgi:hypothetical protein